MHFVHWNQPSSSEATNEILMELALVHASRINSGTVKEYLTNCIVRGDIPALCDFETPYEELSAHDATQCRQISAFFSKRADVDLGFDRAESCLKKFKEAEDLCRETNQLLKMRRVGLFCIRPAVEARIFRAQRKIAHILGDVPSLSDLKIKFGPGATTQVQKRTSSARRKLSQRFACSEELLPVIKESLEELQGWIFTSEDPDTAIVPVEIHPGKLSLVPKNAKTDRAIVVEPSLNTMFQAGIGDYIAKGLKRFGVDIRDQSRNQRLAMEGSLTGDLATLDLSSASDTIAFELISELLPIDWYLFLRNYRTGKIEYKGQVVQLQKFSSMGNGFTFPLETLIFFALACACVEEHEESNVSVYGDDIIVPTYAYANLCELLHVLGFIPNLTKSFCSGSFRESCGADYLKGINIRPSYVKGPLYAFDVFRLHNQYVRRYDVECAEILLKYIDRSLKRWGPDGYGDGHLIRDDGASCRPHGRSRGFSGYVFETYTFAPRRDFKVLPGDRVYPSYCAYSAQDAPYSALSETGGCSRSYRSLRDVALALRDGDLSERVHVYDKEGRLGVSIPGRGTYKLIKVYTLSRG